MNPAQEIAYLKQINALQATIIQLQQQQPFTACNSSLAQGAVIDNAKEFIVDGVRFIGTVNRHKIKSIEQYKLGSIRDSSRYMGNEERSEWVATITGQFDTARKFNMPIYLVPKQAEVAVFGEPLPHSFIYHYQKSVKKYPGYYLGKVIRGVFYNPELIEQIKKQLKAA